MYAIGSGGDYGSVIGGTFVAVGNAGAGPFSHLSTGC